MNESFKNRIVKRHAHLKKWAARQSITCYRVYFRDLPDYPVIIDWIDGDVVVWISPRTKDDTPEKEGSYTDHVITSVATAFSISSDRLFIKGRQKKQGLQDQYQRLDRQKKTKIIQEGGLRFEVNLSDYLDIGLFLDHRLTRALAKQLSLKKRVLNLFAYTGSFSCYAAAGGAASTLTLDLSKTYCDWAQRNLLLNGFDDAHRHHVLNEDCLSYLEKKAYGKRFDLIICDPPTFSNSKKMEQTSFSVERDYPTLLTQCNTLLAPGGSVIFSTNSRKFHLDPGLLPTDLHIEDITSKTVPEDFSSHFIHRAWILKKHDKIAS